MESEGENPTVIVMVVVKRFQKMRPDERHTHTKRKEGEKEETRLD